MERIDIVAGGLFFASALTLILSQGIKVGHGQYFKEFIFSATTVIGISIATVSLSMIAVRVSQGGFWIAGLVLLTFVFFGIIFAAAGVKATAKAWKEFQDYRKWQKNLRQQRRQNSAEPDNQ